MAVYDQRSPPPFGRIPEVEDMFGLVRVENGVMVPESYEKNDMYRLITPDFGVCMFTEFLYNKIRKACEDASRA